MRNSYHESRENQMNQKIHGMEPFNHAHEHYPQGESMQTEHALKKEAVEHIAIMFLAYKIYREKGGSSLDNWLEAERILKNNKHHQKE